MSNVAQLITAEDEALEQAELGVIGALMYERSFLSRAGGLRGEHFANSFLGRVWDEAAAISEHDTADPATLASRLAHLDALREAGGLGFLCDLVNKAYIPAARGYAQTVLNAARLRSTREALTEIGNQIRPGADAFTVLAHAERTLGRMVQESAPASTNLIDANRSAIETMDEIDREAAHGRPRGAMTGLRCFDRRLRGLRPGWLVVIAGRPSMGKTALARAAALGCARRNPRALTVFFALEMARRELDERTLAQLSHEAGDGIAYKDMNGDSLTPQERSRLRELASQVPPNLIIDDSPVLSVDYVRRRALSLKRKAPLSALFIDYLQIMDRPEAKGRNEASVIGEMTKALKQLARELETCVVLLSQINRGVESRDDKRPHLADLRESGAIEQDANAVLFPYRDVYYLERAEPKAAEKREGWEMACEEQRRFMDVIAAKVRQGACGTDRQLYFAEYDVVQDLPERRR